MKLAVNYSLPLLDLVRTQRVAVDYLKLPAWRNVIADAQRVHPSFIHFPLSIGSGIGDAMNHETRLRADWNAIEAMARETTTPLINLHFFASARDFPDIPVDTADPTHIARLTECAIRDVRAVVARFGAERVIVENDNSAGGTTLRPVLLPQVIARVIEETGCGFLLDLSHARMAAQYLGMDTHTYIAALPVKRIREIHITGIQVIEGRWLDALARVEGSRDFIARYAGRWMDHLPMTDADWDAFAWAIGEVRAGRWAEPWVVTFEHGGISPLWEAFTDADALATQVPRLAAMVNGRKEEGNERK
ncbi:MAG: DUF692 family protein [Chloroflexi bacterium]|nr:DUF692 family protein [Chloroflexota bacterium]